MPFIIVSQSSTTNAGAAMQGMADAIASAPGAMNNAIAGGLYTGFDAIAEGIRAKRAREQPDIDKAEQVKLNQQFYNTRLRGTEYENDPVVMFTVENGGNVGEAIGFREKLKQQAQADQSRNYRSDQTNDLRWNIANQTNQTRENIARIGADVRREGMFGGVDPGTGQIVPGTLVTAARNADTSAARAETYREQGQENISLKQRKIEADVAAQDALVNTRQDTLEETIRHNKATEARPSGRMPTEGDAKVAQARRRLELVKNQYITANRRFQALIDQYGADPKEVMAARQAARIARGNYEAELDAIGELEAEAIREKIPSGTQTKPPVVSSDDEYDALPSGTVFMGADGILRTKP